MKRNMSVLNLTLLMSLAFSSSAFCMQPRQIRFNIPENASPNAAIIKGDINGVETGVIDKINKVKEYIRSNCITAVNWVKQNPIKAAGCLGLGIIGAITAEEVIRRVVMNNQPNNPPANPAPAQNPQPNNPPVNPAPVQNPQPNNPPVNPAPVQNPQPNNPPVNPAPVQYIGEFASYAYDPNNQPRGSNNNQPKAKVIVKQNSNLYTDANGVLRRSDWNNNVYKNTFELYSHLKTFNGGSKGCSSCVKRTQKTQKGGCQSGQCSLRKRK